QTELVKRPSLAAQAATFGHQPLYRRMVAGWCSHKRARFIASSPSNPGRNRARLCASRDVKPSVTERFHLTAVGYCTPQCPPRAEKFWCNRFLREWVVPRALWESGKFRLPGEASRHGVPTAKR